MAPIDGRRSDRTNRPRSRGGGRNGLGDSRLGGPTRRRESWPIQNQTERGDKNVSGLPHGPSSGRTSPARSQASNRGECGTPKRSQGCACTPPPPAMRRAPKPAVPRQAQAWWKHREPTSTGARSREFGKQTSDERIGRCSSDGALQGATSRGVPSLKEAVTWLGSPDDRDRWREGEDGAPSSRGYRTIGIREEHGLSSLMAREGRDPQGRIMVSGVSGFSARRL